jgi:hypothetical protein
MVQTGAPDYQQFANWSDVALFSASTNGSTAGITLGTFNVSQWAGLQVNVSSIVGAGGLRFTFFADAGLTQTVGSRLYHMGALLLGPTSYTVPVQGLFCRVACLTNGPVANQCFVTISPTNRVGSPASFSSFPHLFEQVATSVGAGATVNQNAQYFYSGPASLSFGTALAAFTVAIVYFDNLGTQHLVFTETFAAASQANFRSPVMIPPAPCQLQLTNGTAGAGNMTAVVTPGTYAQAA